MLFEHLSPGPQSLGTLAVVILTVLWLRYTAKYETFTSHKGRGRHSATPLTFPYLFPVLGSLPVAYLWKPRDVVLDPKTFFQAAQPVLVKIITYEFYLVRGPENIKALFKSSRSCTSIPFIKFALGYAFGLPAKAISLYQKDDSGFGPVPHPGSMVEDRNRVDFRSYQSLLRFLEGNGLPPFWRRFVDNITLRFSNLHDRSTIEWEYRADLMKFIGDESTISILTALCGPYILSLNPTFLQDFWDFDRNLQTYLQGIPWFLAPKAYLARQRVLNAVRRWHRHAREHYQESALDPYGDDQFWGSRFFRERHDMFLEMDGFDHDAIASADFGLIWAVRNSITAVSWMIFEIYRDPELLARVRAEADACVVRCAGDQVQFDIDRLLHSPFLQAVYAETLRLRMHFYIVRMPDKADLDILGSIMPRRKTIVTLTTVAHMDTTSWPTGSHNEHPLDQFWVGRFLKYPSESTTSDEEADLCASPTFSTKEYEGSWIPYGGGPRQCPGRHFAVRQTLLTTALMVSLFDCEILGEGKNLREDLTLGGFGNGISHPASSVPMRIRRRDRHGFR